MGMNGLTPRSRMQRRIMLEMHPDPHTRSFEGAVTAQPDEKGDVPRHWTGRAVFEDNGEVYVNHAMGAAEDYIGAYRRTALFVEQHNREVERAVARLEPKGSSLSLDELIRQLTKVRDQLQRGEGAFLPVALRLGGAQMQYVDTVSFDAEMYRVVITGNTNNEGG